jgi:His/Glu/Gln/Arg/opine family amino acid ABC transporter permease subunit
MAWELFAYGDTGWGDELLQGLWVTLTIAILSYGSGLVVGVLFALMEMRRGTIVPRLFSAYGAVVRSLPELLVIFFIYFALAYLLEALFSLVGITLRIAFGPFASGVIAMAIVIGSYASEVAKGAFNAVPRGMAEAARALGLSRRQTVLKIVLPLALRHAFPGLSNLWMVVIKTTPLLSAIQIEDFIRAAGTAGQNTKHYFAFYGASIAVYLLISGASMLAQFRIEKRLFQHMGKNAP